MFSIPLLSKMHSTILSAEMFCKVKANFSNHQIFREKFLIYFFEIRPAFQPLFCIPFGLCRGVVLKSECKITTLPRNYQIFWKEFFNEFYSILLNALYLSNLHPLAKSIFNFRLQTRPSYIIRCRLKEAFCSQYISRRPLRH